MRINVPAIKAKAAAAKAAVGTAFLVPFVALAQTTPADDVVTAVTAGGTDGKKVAVAFVLAAWGITAIYMLLRKR